MIWLSALTHSNDWMEGRLVSELFAEVVREDNELASKAEYLQAIQNALLDYSPGFAFCLSKRGDVLSQWRGYADDGNGVSIGFNPIWLNGNPKTILVPPALEEVIYKREKQMEVLRSLYAQMVDCKLKCPVWKSSAPCQNEPFFNSLQTRIGASAWSKRKVAP
ncbi:MAG: DUF2971 domain-containing protein, partial [Pontiella sp.]